jgi:Ca2+-transporting ATPase
MAARRAIVRRLPSVETLGCATVICADKTGTLTTGRMEVRDVWSDDPNDLLRAAASCCDAQLGDGTTADVGDPTELALLRAAAEYGHHRAAIERATPRRSETPFDSQRRRMSVLRADGVLYVKGAVESVLPLCATDAREAMAVNQDMADRGLRVLAVALGTGPEESGLRLLGLVGIADPPRPEAKSAVARARDAGIRTVMITGDHPVTAHAVAAELGLVAAQGSPALYARVTPEEKIRIVRELKGRGEIVAMTGDGVNDAPAIREAHIGIAMGRGGTTVTREASDMVLTDDNFATIVAAVEEGRAVYDNIRKALVYLLTGNASELLLMLAASLLALPLPLLPVHLLWINLVTDGLPALALVMDPPSPGVLSRPPRRTEEPMLGRPEWKSIAWVAGLEVLVVLAVFARALGEGDLARARALAFSTLVFCELFRALASRSRRLLYWQSGVLTNLPLGAVIAVSAFLQLGAAIVPAAAAFFDVRPISLAEAAACVAAGLIPVSVMELRKLSRRVAA